MFYGKINILKLFILLTVIYLLKS